MTRGVSRGRPLLLTPAGLTGRFRAALPEGAPGCWCRLMVRAGTGAWVKLEVEDGSRGQVVREAFLGKPRRRGGLAWRDTLLHLPQAADGLVLQLVADPAAHDAAPCSTPEAALQVLTRHGATLALLRHGWRLLPGALAGNRMGSAGRARAILGQAPARGGQMPGYDVWIRLYDRWGAPERAALGPETGAADIAVVVVGGDAPAIRATLDTLEAQWRAPASVEVVACPTAWSGGDGWVAVLQAGERLAPHALACFARAAGRWPKASGFYADVDRLDSGVRAAPLLKPSTPDPWLLRSGLLTRGACVFQGHRLRATAGRAAEAQSWRDAAASPSEDTADGAMRAIPFILTHSPVLPPGRAVEPASPPAGAAPFVSILVPSAGRSPHMLRCLERLVTHTAYDGGFEVLLAVSHVDPQDKVQADHLARAGLLPFVRVLALDMTVFNYAKVNNKAAREARGTLLLLLNDDVAPVAPDWLARMVARLDGVPGAGIVGARLLYGNGTVQHGGVIMGLANLCEHAFRLSARNDAGPYGVALLDRQVSAVTAACMLVHRSLYVTLGGMDEAFAIALNDVDFCLRAGQAGTRVVYAAGVALYHYESLSLGRHYQGARAGLEALEVRRLRERWAAAIEADPFYNPSASLEPGREFQPAFPVRMTPLRWMAGEAPVPT